MHFVDDLAFLIDAHGHALVSAGVRVEGAVGLAGGSVREVNEEGHLVGEIQGVGKHAGGEAAVDADAKQTGTFSSQDIRLCTVGDELVIAESGEGERLDSSQGASPALNL